MIQLKSYSRVLGYTIKSNILYSRVCTYSTYINQEPSQVEFQTVFIICPMGMILAMQGPGDSLPHPLNTKFHRKVYLCLRIFAIMSSNLKSSSSGTSMVERSLGTYEQYPSDSGLSIILWRCYYPFWLLICFWAFDYSCNTVLLKTPF